MLNTLDQDIVLAAAFFQEVGGLINDTLQQYGGLETGENTYVRGVITASQKSGDIQVMTPQIAATMTPNRVQEIGNTLEDQIIASMLRNGIQDPLELVADNQNGNWNVSARLLVEFGVTA